MNDVQLLNEFAYIMKFDTILSMYITMDKSIINVFLKLFFRNALIFLRHALLGPSTPRGRLFVVVTEAINLAVKNVGRWYVNMRPV